MSKIIIKNKNIINEYAIKALISDVICEALMTELYDMLQIFDGEEN